MLNRKVAVAPMMDWTDQHCRYFLRLITHHSLLYTEMVTSAALIHGKRDNLLKYHPAEQPLALQLGGSNPKELAASAKMAEDYGYNEVNLNVGCPSDRVQAGRFGACLMAEPELVADCIAAMQASVAIPVTVKSRIGIDHQDSYEALTHFISTIAATGCKTFIIHARKAWLQGLSPKENREIPPLRYDIVKKIKDDFPHLQILLNGGITSLEQMEEQLQIFDGVMLGRAAYHNPYLLAEVDQRFYNDSQAVKSREQIITELLPYIEAQLKLNVKLNQITRHILGLYQGVPGARAWRRHLSVEAAKPGAGIKIIHQALAMLTTEY